MLATAEQRALVAETTGSLQSPHEYEAFSDHLKFVLKHALDWVKDHCPAGGSVPEAPDQIGVDNSLQLLDLASDYSAYVSAYTYASRGIVALDVRGHEIVISDELQRDTRFEAYDRLTHLLAMTGLRPPTPQEQLEALVGLIDRAVEVRNGRLSLNLTPKLASVIAEYLKRVFAPAFELPPGWRFSRYSLAEFALVLFALASMATARHLGRLRALDGLNEQGFADAIVLMDTNELEARATRYSGVNGNVVRKILHDLTFCSYGFQLPDPALQPLVRLDDNIVAITPILLMTTSPERNLVALMNRIPKEKEIYARLTAEKEDMMRERLESAIRAAGRRTWHGTIGGSNRLPDIALAIVEDSEKACLITELKWFLEPAEPREVIERGAEIERGIEQLRQLKTAFKQGYQPLLRAISLAPDYNVAYGVISANSIGGSWNQDSEIPVLNEDHLIQKMQVRGLPSTISWLRTHSFLPTEGHHFNVVPDIRHVGAWELKWYAIQILDPNPPL